MFVAMRWLTFVAFTAHAVLGCCLSHGKCTQEHAAIAFGHGCEHEEHAADHFFGPHEDSGVHKDSGVQEDRGVHVDSGVHENGDGHPHIAFEAAAHMLGDAVSTASECCVSSPLEPHHHSHHCDDVSCIFGALTGTFSASACQILVDASWISTHADFELKSSVRSRSAIDCRGSLPKATLSRAAHQVWLI